MKRLSILGTRGIPAHHGGFETFAEKLALFLVTKGWRVTVYCQLDGDGPVTTDTWRGVRRVNIPVLRKGAMGTVLFDWKSTLQAKREEGQILTLGYNTAVFCLHYRLAGKINLINMDGLEWQRDKWSFVERAWLYLNERAGCWLGNHLIADHPEIQKYLASRVKSEKVTMIPYGADRIDDADDALIETYGLKSKGYSLVIARAEPENFILEIVKAFSFRKRNQKLVVLGNYAPAENEYHRSVLQAASNEVIFPGAIYDKATVSSLRFHTLLYVHGHTVGGTNPSLVEALGAGSAVLAHDNFFNRWVAGDGAAYFISEIDCNHRFDELLSDHNKLERMRVWSRRRFAQQFQWDDVLGKYEQLLGLLCR